MRDGAADDREEPRGRGRPREAEVLDQPARGRLAPLDGPVAQRAEDQRRAEPGGEHAAPEPGLAGRMRDNVAAAEPPEELQRREPVAQPEAVHDQPVIAGPDRREAGEPIGECPGPGRRAVPRDEPLRRRDRREDLRREVPIRLELDEVVRGRRVPEVFLAGPAATAVRAGEDQGPAEVRAEPGGRGDVPGGRRHAEPPRGAGRPAEGLVPAGAAGIDARDDPRLPAPGRPPPAWIGSQDGRASPPADAEGAFIRESLPRLGDRRRHPQFNHISPKNKIRFLPRRSRISSALRPPPASSPRRSCGGVDHRPLRGPSLDAAERRKRHSTAGSGEREQSSGEVRSELPADVIRSHRAFCFLPFASPPREKKREFTDSPPP